MTESYLWTLLRSQKALDDVHMTRVENAAGSGILDTTACCGGVEAWVELKIFKGSRLFFRNSQRIWVRERTGAGGRCLVLARGDDVIILYRAIDLVNLPHNVVVRGKSFSVKPGDYPDDAPQLFCSGKPYDWGLLKRLIFGEQPSLNIPGKDGKNP